MRYFLEAFQNGTMQGIVILSRIGFTVTQIS